MKAKNQFTLVDRVLVVIWTIVFGILLLAARWYLPAEAFADIIVVVVAALIGNVTVRFRVFERELAQLSVVAEKAGDAK